MSYDDLSRFLACTVSADNVIFAGDDELMANEPLTDDDLDIWKGLPSNENHTSDKSPAVAMSGLNVLISRKAFRRLLIVE